MTDERRCVNCKYFGESSQHKIYCGRFGKYDEIIHNPEQEKCNFHETKKEKKQ